MLSKVLAGRCFYGAVIIMQRQDSLDWRTISVHRGARVCSSLAYFAP